jgi:hypothetical protein
LLCTPRIQKIPLANLLCAPGIKVIPGELEKWFAGDKNSKNPKQFKKFKKSQKNSKNEINIEKYTYMIF